MKFIPDAMDFELLNSSAASAEQAMEPLDTPPGCGDSQLLWLRRLLKKPQKSLAYTLASKMRLCNCTVPRIELEQARENQNGVHSQRVKGTKKMN